MTYFDLNAKIAFLPFLINNVSSLNLILFLQKVNSIDTKIVYFFIYSLVLEYINQLNHRIHLLF